MAAAEILFVQTGGTIDKDYPSPLHGYAFEIMSPATQRILAAVETAWTPAHTKVATKDSTDLTDEDRARIAEACASAPQTKCLITHGTSTMVQTARTIAEACPDKQIVITGALLPERFKQSDAAFNVGFALGVLQTMRGPGIFVAMSGTAHPFDEVARHPTTGQFVHISTPGCVAGDDPGIALSLSLAAVAAEP